MVVTCTGLEKLLEGGEADWPGLVDEPGRGFSKNQYEMSSGGEKSGLIRLGRSQWSPVGVGLVMADFAPFATKHKREAHLIMPWTSLYMVNAERGSGCLGGVVGSSIANIGAANTRPRF